MSHTITGAENIHWDLSDLYSNPNDPQILADKDSIRSQADAFAATYRGKVAQLSAAEMNVALSTAEEIYDTLGKLGSFSYLAWSVNTEDEVLGKLMQSMQEFSSEISQKLVFFDVEWMKTDEEVAQKCIQAPEVCAFKHYLEASRRYVKHTLEEGQEQVMSAKSVTGRSAWVRYFDETLGAKRWTFRGEELSEQEILAKLHDADRETRKEAAQSFTNGLRDIKRSLTFAFNTIVADKSSDDKMRGYEHWLQSRNLSNEIADETVQALVDAVKSYYPVVQRYYKLKTKLLGFDQMYDYDRYAPLMETETVVSWQKAQDMVMNSYTEFHPEMGKITGEFFDKKWIDAALKPGKRSGAYSASTVPSVHPYVFMNYTGKLRDVQTLAHELGHGVHQYLSRKQGVLQSDTPLTTAETASVFGEMLVFQNILKTLTDPKERLALLVEKIDDTIATVFRQISMNRFEHAMHTARREEGELSSDRFSALWMESQKDLYGDAIELTENYGLWWSYIPHFLHTPGYVYAYSFGELLVLALYQKFLDSPENFQDNYLEMLSMGGSDWPENIVMKMGVDITDKDFWKKGLSLFEEMVTQAETQAQNAGLIP